MPLFSRGHYLEVGKVLHSVYHNDTRLVQPAETHRRLTIRRITWKLADLFEKDNTGFDRKRFMNDTGVQDSIPNEEETHGKTQEVD